MKRPYPTTRALAEMIRAGDPKAEKYVIQELKRAGGSVTAAAEALGCSVRVLYAWRDSNERLAEAFREHALGRAGAGPLASAVRAERLRSK